jgi:hypothetical protein
MREPLVLVASKLISAMAPCGAGFRVACGRHTQCITLHTFYRNKQNSSREITDPGYALHAASIMLISTWSSELDSRLNLPTTCVKEKKEAR